MRGRVSCSPPMRLFASIRLEGLSAAWLGKAGKHLHTFASCSAARLDRARHTRDQRILVERLARAINAARLDMFLSKACPLNKGGAILTRNRVRRRASLLPKWMTTAHRDAFAPEIVEIANASSRGRPEVRTRSNGCRNYSAARLSDAQTTL